MLAKIPTKIKALAVAILCAAVTVAVVRHRIDSRLEASLPRFPNPPASPTGEAPLPSITEGPCAISYRFDQGPESTFLDDDLGLKDLPEEAFIQGSGFLFPRARGKFRNRPADTWKFVSDGQSWRSELTTLRGYADGSLSHLIWTKRSVWTNWVNAVERRFTTQEAIYPNGEVRVNAPPHFYEAHEEFKWAIFPFMTSHVAPSRPGELPIPIRAFIDSPEAVRSTDALGFKVATRALDDTTSVSVSWDNKGRTRLVSRCEFRDGISMEMRFNLIGVRVEDGRQCPSMIRQQRILNGAEVESILIFVNKLEIGPATPVLLPEARRVRAFTESKQLWEHRLGFGVKDYRRPVH